MLQEPLRSAQWMRLKSMLNYKNTNFICIVKIIKLVYFQVLLPYLIFLATLKPIGILF